MCTTITENVEALESHRCLQPPNLLFFCDMCYLYVLTGTQACMYMAHMENLSRQLLQCSLYTVMYILNKRGKNVSFSFNLIVTISDALLPILKIQVSLRCCFLFSLNLLSHFCRADHLAITFLFLWSKMLLICLLSWRVFLLDTEFRFDDFFC